MSNKVPKNGLQKIKKLMIVGSFGLTLCLMFSKYYKTKLIFTFDNTQF
jgi:hypothetical protein